MSTFTSLGIGSNLDLNSMVTQLVALERAPLSQMQRSASKLQTQVSSFGKMQGLFGTLQDAANKLGGSPLWAQAVASSSDAASVTAIGGAGAAAGNYAVQVQALAGSQTLASSTVFGAATDLAGSGTLTLAVGGWDAARTVFTAGAAAPVTLAIAATDTLENLRDKINSADAGVTATLVTDATGVRVALRSTDSGAANGFRIQAADNDGGNADAAGLSRFAFDPPGGAAAMEFKQAASNALATVNGIAVQSASNELAGVVDGLTLQLRKVTTNPVDVAVSRDREAVVASVRTFADAYNALATYIAEQTKYDAASKIGGPLQGDSAVSTLQSQLRAVLATSSGASAAFPRLSDIGLQAQRDGTLSVDAAKLGSATADLVELKKAFANNDTLNAANNGFARRYAALAGQVLGVDGSLATRSEGLRKLISKNSDDQDKLNDRVDRFQKRLVQQYTAMDANLAKLNSLSSYMNAQLAALTKTSNR